ncbi:MAG: hypothetical protein QG654_193 [Patescibacteria group bacterium]|nr:hypothetical protein [Patescibacteria group bacterium]
MTKKIIIVIVGVVIVVSICYFFFIRGNRIENVELNYLRNENGQIIIPLDQKEVDTRDWVSKRGFSPEYEERFRKTMEYFNFDGKGQYLTKDIDKDLLLARQYGTKKYTAEDYTLLNTEKLTQVTQAEFDAVKQKGIEVLSVTVKDNSVRTDGPCLNADLDNGEIYSKCNPQPNEYGVVTKYIGFIPSKNLYLFSWAIEEGGYSFVSKKDGRFYSTTYLKNVFIPNTNYMISYSDQFFGGYVMGGIEVIEFDKPSDVSEDFYNHKTYGGYSGAERWGVKEVRVSSPTVFYFKTVGRVEYNSEEVYSYFKQELK